MRLAGRSAIVTGSGIGRASAVLFAKEGAFVGLVDRDRAGLQETLAAIEGANGEASQHVGEADFAKATVGEVMARRGRPDVLMAAAARSASDARFLSAISAALFLQPHCCHRQRHAPPGKARPSSAGDREACPLSPGYQSRMSLLQKPKRSLLFKSLSDDHQYIGATNPRNRKKSERLRASPDLEKSRTHGTRAGAGSICRRPYSQSKGQIIDRHAAALGRP